MALVSVPLFAHLPQLPAAYLAIFGSTGGAQMYMESLYLPPVTTGPWAPAWSPDGERIAFAMQGSLWQVPASGGEAVQVTSSVHFDSEPEWSPDGNRIVFTRDDGRSIEIWSVGSDGSDSRQLTATGGLNVNPRWSPDGGEVLYTASSERGKLFGIWAIRPGDPQAEPFVVDEHQNITPAWAPDGERAVFVSNRSFNGRPIVGTGGIWQIRRGMEPTILLQEETSWQARPTWSPNGAKIAYVSYRTGHHELWLLSPEAANPIQLTHFDNEVFTPAWSPDSSTLAFISNAGGKFTLWRVPAVGGPPTEVRITSLDHRQPVGTLEVIVNDSADGEPTAARVYVTASDGKPYTPRGAFHRHSVVTDSHYFHTSGRFEIDLPEGRTSVEVAKGFEYEPQKMELDIVGGENHRIEFSLERLTDMAAQGWHSGDNHIHLNYGGIYDATPESVWLEAEAEDLNVVNNLIANRSGGRIYDMKYFEGKLHDLSRDRRLIYFNQEYRPSFTGHMALLNLQSLVYPLHASTNTAQSALYPTNSHVLDAVHEQGGVGGYVHPYLYARGEDPASYDYGGAREFPVNAALGNVDYFDVACIWSDEYVGAEVWYRLLNLGFKIPASAGTDAMTDYWRAPAIGTVRVYVQTGTPLRYGDWIRGLTSGKTFVTNGPLVTFRVDGREAGSELQLADAGNSSVRVQAEARSILPMETLDVLVNGAVVHSVRAESPSTVALDVEIPISESGWVGVRITGPERQHLLMDSYVYAHTSPVYLSKGGRSARSPEDARYFLGWIDRSIELIEGNDRFDTPEQKSEVLSVWHRAREVYADLAEH